MSEDPIVYVYYIETVIGDIGNQQRNSFLLVAQDEEDAIDKLGYYDKAFAQNVDFIINMGKWEGTFGVRESLDKDEIVDVPWREK